MWADEYREVSERHREQSQQCVRRPVLTVSVSRFDCNCSDTLRGPAFPVAKRNGVFSNEARSQPIIDSSLTTTLGRTGSRDERDRLLIRNLLEAVDDINRKFKGAFDGYPAALGHSQSSRANPGNSLPGSRRSSRSAEGPVAVPRRPSAVRTRKWCPRALDYPIDAQGNLRSMPRRTTYFCHIGRLLLC